HRSFHRALQSLDRLQTKRRATPQSTPTPVTDPPPEAKPNSAQPQSAQQKIGFVPSFSPAPDSASPKPVQAAVPEAVTHPPCTGPSRNYPNRITLGGIRRVATLSIPRVWIRCLTFLSLWLAALAQFAPAQSLDSRLYSEMHWRSIA